MREDMLQLIRSKIKEKQAGCGCSGGAVKSVCPIDEQGFCSKHKIYHIGKWRELSQADTAEGAEVRAKWDRWVNEKAPS